jgi:Anti-sigma factor NepR
MPKQLHQPYASGTHRDWSVGSNSLTPTGQSEFLRHLGHHLQANYQNILKEPAPERIKQLLESLERSRHPERDEDP